MSESVNKKRNIAVVIAGLVVLFAFVYLFVFHSSINSAPVIKNGDNVSVFYTLTLANGTLIQSNFNSTPFSFIVGSGQVISGFNSAVLGMKAGQTKNVTLSPSEAYGNVNASLIITVPKSDFKNASLSDGERVSSSTGQTGVITRLNSTNVTVDFNPPLAGKTLHFYIKIIKINNN